MSAKILLVDDEDLFREDLATLLREEGFTCLTAADGEEGLRLAERESPDVVLCDLVLPNLGGVEVVERLRALSPESVAIVLTAHGTVETAVATFRSGAVDYLFKPVLFEDLLQKLRRTLETKRLQRELRHLRREVATAGGGTEIAGGSAAIVALRALIAKVGPADSTVLLTGESGTGKELVARALHQAGRGDAAPFIAVNCAAFPRDLMESELFGHVRGAFTGAYRDRLGLFELAHGGTLFLDEIGEMPLELQPKLLRAVERREILRVGATKPVVVAARILAASNRDLKAEIAAGRFREDLYYRLAVIELHLPPLRERREDVPLLIEHLIRRLAARLKRRVVGVEPAALQALLGARWPGNVRELENVLERAVLLAEGERLGPADLPADLVGQRPAGPVPDDLRAAVRVYEREHVRSILATCGGNREEAARRLGIDASTLYRRLRELEL